MRIATLCVFALTVLASAGRADTLEFEGRIEPFARGELSSRLDGVVTEIRFTGGERVSKGDALIMLDGADADLAVLAADAEVLRAKTDLTQARQDAQRLGQLRARGVVTPVQLQAAERTLGVAEASLASAQAAAQRARLDRERTAIRAAIDGIISPPTTAIGAFVEAESGAPLGEILQIDPARVAYRVPYAVRLASLEQAGVASVDALLERIELRITLPNGRPYPHPAHPDRASASVDPEDGTFVVWATVANPDALLRPGLKVTVHTMLPDSGRD